MELLKREQIAGMNIHYLFYPWEYFLDAQVRAGIQTIEFWLGTPHFFLSHIEYTECVRVRKMIENRGLKVKIITPENCTYQYQYERTDHGPTVEIKRQRGSIYLDFQ